MLVLIPLSPLVQSGNGSRNGAANNHESFFFLLNAIGWRRSHSKEYLETLLRHAETYLPSDPVN